MRFCYYSLHFSKVGRLKKRPSLGTILGQGLGKNTKTGGSKKTQKHIPKQDTKMDTKMGPFGGHFETHFKAIRNLGSLGPPWLHLGPPWLHFGVILESFCGSFFVILDAVLQTFYVFCRVSVGSSNDSYLCWNTPIMFPDVFQDTLFYE